MPLVKVVEMEAFSSEERIPLSQFASAGRDLRDDEAFVIVLPWTTVVSQRVRAWLNPLQLGLLLVFAVTWGAVLLRASARGRLEVTLFAGIIGTIAVAAWLWSFYRRLPNAGLPVLLRVALRSGDVVPGFQLHLDDGRAVAPATPVAPVTAVVLLPGADGLGLVGKAGVVPLRPHGVTVEIICARNGRVGRARFVSPGVGTQVVHAAGNVKRVRRP